MRRPQPHACARRVLLILAVPALLAGPARWDAAQAADQGAAAPAAAPAQAPAPAAPAPEEGSRWSAWWAWMPDVFGLNFGGITYGGGRNLVVGSDKLVHDVRVLPALHAVELHAPVDIVIRQGPIERITLHTDDNVAPLIETAVEDGVLRIGIKPGARFRVRHPIGATVELRTLGSLKVLGSGDVTCAQLDADMLEVTVQGSGDVRVDALRARTLAVLVQGSGDVRLSGNVPQQGYVIEGSGDVDAKELTGQDVAVRIAGSGDAHVWAMRNLAVEIGGSGDVIYHGRPAVEQHVHGSGSVEHRD